MQLSALFRLLGHFNLLVGALGVWLLWRFARERRAWMARTVTASSRLAYLGPIVFDNSVGSIGTFELLEHILFAAMLLSAALYYRDLGAISNQ